MARAFPEVNGGSMADIAFMLLIFFLVTTTMDVDTGIARVLPPPAQEEDLKNTDKVKERNILTILVNKNDALLVKGDRLHISDLKNVAKDFIANPANKDNLPEKEILSSKLEKAIAKGSLEEANKYRTAIRLIGDLPAPKGIISLQNDRGTSYDAYISVQNELTAAYNELRNELAFQTFGKEYAKLNEEEAESIRLIYPMAISEAEPKNVGGN
jgi:biopolymer transport protein ExbD